MSSQKKNKTKLTKRVVESAVPDPIKRIEIWDTEITGFFVRVYPTGRKTYFLQYRNKKRETHKVKIGVHSPKTTTELARQMANRLSLNIGAGEDPSIKTVSNNKEKTMQELAEEYLRLHAEPNKALQCYKDDMSKIKNIILKKYGHLRVNTITNLDLQKLHSELYKTPVKANRTIALLSTMFNFAIRWGWRSDNPVKGIKKYKEHGRDRWLNDEEVQRLLTSLNNYRNQNVANAIRLLVLMGSRKTEVLSAKWEQIDLERGTWTMRARSTKQRKMEYLPVSSPVLEILTNMKTHADSPFLFPGKVPGQPLKDPKKAWNTIRNKAGVSDVHIHDLRHTFASHLVSSGVSLSIVGKLLGHTQASTTQRYAHLAVAPLREAAELFGNKVQELVSQR
ncbi:MAG: site-specific integrase [Alphaproteobacteria bacterium]|nr:site-specific integrase [Alphaproteobacteria bacterium]